MRYENLDESWIRPVQIFIFLPTHPCAKAPFWDDFLPLYFNFDTRYRRRGQTKRGFPKKKHTAVFFIFVIYPLPYRPAFIRGIGDVAQSAAVRATRLTTVVRISFIMSRFEIIDEGRLNAEPKSIEFKTKIVKIIENQRAKSRGKNLYQNRRH